jgi:hypothetical protein
MQTPFMPAPSGFFFLMFSHWPHSFPHFVSATPLRGFFLCVFWAFFGQSTQAQDLFDQSHTLQYAKYLMRSGNYEQAGLEYQRLAFMRPENDTFKVELLRAYRLGKQYDLGIKQYQTWKDGQSSIGQPVQFEFAKVLLIGGHAPDAIAFAGTPGNLSAPTDQQVQLYGYLLQQDWPNARQRYDNWPESTPLPGKNSIGPLFQRADGMRYKKPWVAAGLSAVLPGAGKAYTDDWVDGAIALLMVGLNTVQCYRRFDRQGIDSAWGWFHGGFAVGFYVGNVYGAHKAARMYNQRKKHKLQHETERIVYPLLR